MLKVLLAINFVDSRKLAYSTIFVSNTLDMANDFRLLYEIGIYIIIFFCALKHYFNSILKSFLQVYGGMLKATANKNACGLFIKKMLKVYFISFHFDG
jgi:hypothetical protein